MKSLNMILKFESINNIYKNRIILDYIYTFIKKCIIEKNTEENDINENYKSIREKIIKLNEIIKRPYQKNIYEEAFKLRDKICDDLIDPDIIMLNSNPLKNITGNNYSLNNQYYILNKLQKEINKHIRIKTYVLNTSNLSKALNEKGEILIIQSDDFTDKGEIVYESKNGESEILKMNNLIDIIEDKAINYKVIILCFKNSYKVKDYFNKFPYVIYFEYFNNLNLKENILKEYNNASIEFLIDFIKNITNEKYNNELSNIFISTKMKFLENIKPIINEINCRDYIILSSKENYIDIKIKYLKEIEDNQLFLYDSLIKFNNLNINENEDIQNYASQIYKIILKIKNENNIIYYSDESTKSKYLKTCFEVIKFYYRHKLYNELFCIDIKEGNKILLKSIIRKYDEFKYIDREEDNENETNFQKKNCFILIYNCYWHDLLDVNLYSLLNNNSSYIIIYDNYSNRYNKNNNIIIKLVKMEKEEEKEETMEQPIEISKSLGNLNNEYIFLERIKKIKMRYTYIMMNDISENKYIIDFILNENNDFRKNEIESLNKLKMINNTYILKFIEYGRGTILFKNTFYKNRPYIIFENAQKYNLCDYLMVDSISEKHSKLIFKKILEGVKAIHDINLCHRYIDINNILLDEEYNPKIYGFNFCCENSTIIQDFAGSLRFASPEIMSNKQYDGKKSDIFSLGQLLFCLTTSRYGFDSSKFDDNYYRYIKEKNYTEYWKIHPYDLKNDLSESFKKLFVKMVAYEPEERPNIPEILNSDWMNDINNLNEIEVKKLEDEIRKEFEIRKDIIKEKKI